MPNSEPTIFRQIARFIEDGILSGAFLEEEAVPSTNQFARLYGINPATAAKGFALLSEEGLLYRQRGLGMFVSRGAREVILSRRRSAFYGEYLLPLYKEAKYLGISKAHLFQMLNQAEEDKPNARNGA